MLTDFSNKPDFSPWSHLPNQVPLDMGVTAAHAANERPASSLETAWMKAKVKMFAGKTNKPGLIDPYVLNHLDWYEATEWKRAYPGESRVQPPTAFAERIAHPKYDLDD